MQHLDLGPCIHKCRPNSDTIGLPVLEKVYKKYDIYQQEAKWGDFWTLNQANVCHMPRYNEHAGTLKIMPE